LPEDVVTAKIKDGTITPKLERKQVGEIRTMEANANHGSYLRPPECPPTTEANTAHARYLRPPDARRFSSIRLHRLRQAWRGSAVGILARADGDGLQAA
jgi:hypothetical protein